MLNLLHLAQQNPATHAGMLMAVFKAGAQGSANTAWIEVSRPLTILALNAPFATQGAAGAGIAYLAPLVIATNLSLPLGMDIKSITATCGDIDEGWCFSVLNFGSLLMLNMNSSPGVPGNMSMFDPRLEHQDRVAPWILSKTAFDVQVNATVVNAAFYANYPAAPAGQLAIFHGLSLNAIQEEQICAIQERLAPTGRNMGNLDILAQLRHAFASVAGVQVAVQHIQPPSQTGRVPVQAYYPVGSAPQPQWQPSLSVAALMPQQQMGTWTGGPGR